MKETIERLRAALKAAVYAEAWPDDPHAQRLAADAFETLLSGDSNGRDEIRAALLRAEALPQERLDLSMLTHVCRRTPTWACTEEVGEVLVRRIREAPFFPKTLWRVEWVPGPTNWGFGCVIAWNANEERTKAIQLGDLPVGPGLACFTPHSIEKEIIYRMGPGFVRLMLHTDECNFTGKVALVFEPAGLGSLEAARRAAYVFGEACWREHAIPEMHRTWEEILEAGGPLSEGVSPA